MIWIDEIGIKMMINKFKFDKTNNETKERSNSSKCYILILRMKNYS